MVSIHSLINPAIGIFTARKQKIGYQFGHVTVLKQGRLHEFQTGGKTTTILQIAQFLFRALKNSEMHCLALLQLARNRVSPNEILKDLFEICLNWKCIIRNTNYCPIRFKMCLATVYNKES